MTDYSELKRLAEAANAVTSDVNVEMTLASESGPNQAEIDAVTAFMGMAIPAAVLAMLADIEYLTESRQEAREERNRIGDRHDALEAERDQLKAENEVLRKGLAECATSLEGEMLQKFGGQKPEDMHPVTRRDYDRYMAELAGYRAAMGKGEQA